MTTTMAQEEQQTRLKDNVVELLRLGGDYYDIEVAVTDAIAEYDDKSVYCDIYKR